LEADLECVSTAVDALRSLGLDGFEVRVNDRKVLDGMMESLSLEGQYEMQVFRALDRLDKVGEARVLQELVDRGVGEDKAQKILGFTHLKGDEALEFARIEFGSSKATMEGIDELRQLQSMADAFGLGKLLHIDFSLVRGLDYYTGPVFEIRAGSGEIGSVAGGGRYDGLIERFGGPSTPATGISLGVERLYEVLFEKISKDDGLKNSGVFVANVNEATAPDAVRISRDLQSMRVRAESDVMGRKLGRQLEYADSKGIPYVLIVGQEELRSGKFKLKDMRNKREIIGSVAEIAEVVKQQV